MFLFESTLPFCTSSASRLLHSLRKMLAPVRLPSPPHTHKLVMPFFTRLRAAASLPSRVVKALHRALPITVPPCSHMTSHKPNQDIVICRQKNVMLSERDMSFCSGNKNQDPITKSHSKHICDFDGQYELQLLYSSGSQHVSQDESKRS